MWGMNVHNAVIEAKEIESGATVHFVTPWIDEGEAILQKSFEVTAEDTPETLAQKVHQIEYEIFPIAINKVPQEMNKYNNVSVYQFTNVEGIVTLLD